MPRNHTGKTDACEEQRPPEPLGSPHRWSLLDTAPPCASQHVRSQEAAQVGHGPFSPSQCWAQGLDSYLEREGAED